MTLSPPWRSENKVEYGGSAGAAINLFEDGAVTMDKKAALTILTALMLLTASAAAGCRPDEPPPTPFSTTSGDRFRLGHVKVVGRGRDSLREGEFDRRGHAPCSGRTGPVARWELTMDCDEMILRKPRGQKIIARKVTRFHDPAGK